MEKIIKQLELAHKALQKKLEETQKLSEELGAKEKQLDERQAFLLERGKELNEREEKVKRVEADKDFKKKAKALMEKAKETTLAVEKQKADLQAKIEKFNKEKANALADIANKEEANRKQKDALIKERNEFEIQKKALKDLGKL